MLSRSEWGISVVAGAQVHATLSSLVAQPAVPSLTKSRLPRRAAPDNRNVRVDVSLNSHGDTGRRAHLRYGGARYTTTENTQFMIEEAYRDADCPAPKCDCILH